jgi:Ca-activated chloride channel family protein
MKAALLLLVLFVRPPSVVAIHGRVTDASRGNGIAGASIVIPELNLRAQTDSAGRYNFRSTGLAANGTVTIEARRIGYVARNVSVAIRGRTDITLDIALSASMSHLDEVIVSGIAKMRASSMQQLNAPAPTISGYALPRREPGNTEGYNVINENTYMLARERPLSTFSVDVDRASYSNVRRFLSSGQRPPIDAVRIEEMVNYFPYDYQNPASADPVSISTSVAAAPWNTAHRLVLIGLKAKPIATASLPPNNLVFLIDVSGSMQSPDKLPLVKSAFELLVNQLREQDRVSIVVYAGSAGLVLRSTSGSNKQDILDAITRLEAGGSTAGGAGLRLAYDVATQNFIREGNNRVILATDGDFNVGVSSDAEMVRLIEDRRKTGVFLTALGFGTGNLKDSKMEQMADHGNGHYAYVDNLLEAKKVFVRELGATLRTVAKDVKLQIEFNPARVAAYRLIGYENRLLNDADFADDTKDAGDMGAGHTVTALYEVIPVGVANDPFIPKANDLRYKHESATQRTAANEELLYVKLRYKEPDGSISKLMTRVVPDAIRSRNSDFAFASAVAEFGLLLRDSKFKGKASYAGVVETARANIGKDPDGLRAEFVRLVQKAAALDLVANQ